MADQATNKGSLAIGATDATSVALNTLAEHIGKMAGLARLQQMPEGTYMGGGAQVQAPTPAVIPQPGNPGAVPLIGGGNINGDLAKKQDLTNLFNTVKQGLDVYTAKKNQENVIKASRDYESLMKAYQINQGLQEQLKADPNNPTLKAMVEQNNSVINGFFDDEKKRKRLEKVMGIETEAKAAVAGGNDAAKAKTQDPEYIAFKKAQQAVKDGSVSPGINGEPLPQIGGTPSSLNPQHSSMGQENLGMPSNMPPPWLQGLNPRAAQFFGKQPVAPSTPTYVPSPAELGDAWRVANKIAPDGNAKADVMKAAIEWQSRGLGEIFKGLNERDMKEAELAGKKYGDDLDAGTRFQLGLADIKYKYNALALDKWYKENELMLKDKEMQLKSADTFGKVYDQGVAIANENLKLAEQGYLAAQEAAKTAKTMGTAGDSKKGNSDLIAAGYQRLLEAHQKLDQVTKEREDFNARARGITTNPSGAGTGQSVINKLKAESPVSTGDSGANPPAATVPAGLPAPSRSSGLVNKGVELFNNGVLPWFGGGNKGPI